jgi:hypothetical protein
VEVEKSCDDREICVEPIARSSEFDGMKSRKYDTTVDLVCVLDNIISVPQRARLRFLTFSL